MRRRPFRARGFVGAPPGGGARVLPLVFGREEAELIPRYSLPEMAELWTDRARLARWLEVELLATEGWATLGTVPAEDARACRANAPVVDDAFVAQVAERERVTDHDVAA